MALTHQGLAEIERDRQGERLVRRALHQLEWRADLRGRGTHLEIRDCCSWIAEASLRRRSNTASPWCVGEWRREQRLARSGRQAAIADTRTYGGQLAAIAIRNQKANHRDRILMCCGAERFVSPERPCSAGATRAWLSEDRRADPQHRRAGASVSGRNP